MKILYITHYTKLYGANKSLLETALAVNALEGCTAEVVIPGKCEMSEKLEENGVKCIYSSVTTWQAVYVNSLRFGVKKIIRKGKINREFKTLYRLLSKDKPDIIHSNSSVVGVGALLAEKLGCRHVWHIREFSEEHYGMKYFYPEKRVRELYEKADCLITISEALKENYLRRYPGARVERVYNGLKKKAFPQRSYEAGPTLNMVYTGYVFPMKHQLEVVKNCKKMLEEGFSGFEMYFYGDGTAPYEARIKKYIVDNHLEEKVHYMGYVPNADEMLGKMDVGIIASEYEAFGRVTVEYMLNSLPVIAYDDAGSREVVLNGVTGYLYKTDEEFIESVKKLCDPGLREKMGKAGLNRAEKNFLNDKNLENIFNIYKAVMDGKN